MDTEFIYGLDTSVVMRLLTGDPPEQAEPALRFIEEIQVQGQRAIVSDLVISEAYFALQHHYGVSKPQAIKQLLAFLDSGKVLSEASSCAHEALLRADAGSMKPGLVDRMIHAQYIRQNARLVTFEEHGGRLSRALLLTTA